MSIQTELENILGQKNVSSEEMDKLAYARDSFPLTLMQYKSEEILKQPTPDFIVWPETKEQIQRLLKFCNEKKIPIIPGGGFAGVCGGTTPRGGDIILDTKKFDKIIGINEESRLVTVQAGVLGQHLENYLNERGFTYGHFPSSLQCSTIGGFAATSSAGALSSKYGKIEDMITDLEVILPNGEIIHTNEKLAPRSSVGPKLTQLFIGSEGTLGIITEITLRIHPLPDFREFVGMLFPTLKDGLNAVHEIFQTSIRPAVVRLYDDVEARMVYGIEDIKKGQSYLTLAFDGIEKEREIILMQKKLCYDICINNKGEDMGEEGGKIWWENRLNMYYPNRQYAKANVLADTIDVVTTFDNLENLYIKMKEAVGRKRINVMAHWSHFYPDGGSMYTIFVMIEKDTKKEKRATNLYKQAWFDGLSACLKAGGVIAHHHGIGDNNFKGQFMKEQLGTSFQLLKDLKKTLDPNNIMNPGKLGL
ncbi:MAG: FAD-binding oxidoreductase [Candidatus Helarchaeota archaeon]